MLDMPVSLNKFFDDENLKGIDAAFTDEYAILRVYYVSSPGVSP